MNLANGNIHRQETIHTFPKGLQGQFAPGQKMGRHAAGMHPGIGPPRRMNAHRLAENLRQGRFDDFLDSNPVGLNLPTDIGGAVVLDFQEDRAHSVQPSSQ